ncbi:MAG: FtsX-like permease family protein, partial [Lachnospiraceae bacterium]|nr:FtsX-like permease family protein [Lachnospiraceae bacterium]
KLLPAFDMVECHAMVGINGGDVMTFMAEDGRTVLKDYLAEMEETLSEHGMPATCVQDLMIPLTVRNGEKEAQIQCFQATGAKIDQFARIEGTAPEAPGEIAMTRLAAESIGADIGDTIVIVSMEGEREYLITALYQTMNNRGYGVRFHEDENIDYIQVSGGMSGQIIFTDNPGKKEVKERIEKINTFFDKYGEVILVEEWVKEAVSVADTMNAIKGLMTGLTIVLVALVTVLLERSFIAKETREIALMKAMGLKNGKIYGYHVARFALVGVVAVLFAELLLRPFLWLCIDPIFRMMGMEVAVDYAINPAEVYVVLPLVVLGTTMVTAFLTVLYTKKIKAADVAGLE